MIREIPNELRFCLKAHFPICSRPLDPTMCGHEAAVMGNR